MSNMKRMAESADLKAAFAEDFVMWRDKPTFDGITYDERQDQQRLGKQAQAVWDFMALWAHHPDQWITLRELALNLGFPEASVSARLRDFRKPRFGSHTVERRRRKDGHGTWEYRLVVNDGGEE